MIGDACFHTLLTTASYQQKNTHTHSKRKHSKSNKVATINSSSEALWDTSKLSADGKLLIMVLIRSRKCDHEDYSGANCSTTQQFLQCVILPLLFSLKAKVQLFFQTSFKGRLDRSVMNVQLCRFLDHSFVIQMNVLLQLVNKSWRLDLLSVLHFCLLLRGF